MEQEQEVLVEIIKKVSTHLTEFDSLLITLTKQPKSFDCLNALFQHLQDIKSLIGVFKHRSIKKIIVGALNLIELLQIEHVEVTSNVISVLQETSHSLKAILANIEQNKKEAVLGYHDLIKMLNSFGDVDTVSLMAEKIDKRIEEALLNAANDFNVEDDETLLEKSIEDAAKNTGDTHYAYEQRAYEDALKNIKKTILKYLPGNHTNLRDALMEAAKVSRKANIPKFSLKGIDAAINQVIQQEMQTAAKENALNRNLTKEELEDVITEEAAKQQRMLQSLTDDSQTNDQQSDIGDAASVTGALEAVKINQEKAEVIQKTEDKVSTAKKAKEKALLGDDDKDNQISQEEAFEMALDKAGKGETIELFDSAEKLANQIVEKVSDENKTLEKNESVLDEADARIDKQEERISEVEQQIEDTKEFVAEIKEQDELIESDDIVSGAKQAFEEALKNTVKEEDLEINSERLEGLADKMAALVGESVKNISEKAEEQIEAVSNINKKAFDKKADVTKSPIEGIDLTDKKDRDTVEAMDERKEATAKSTELTDKKETVEPAKNKIAAQVDRAKIQVNKEIDKGDKQAVTVSKTVTDEIVSPDNVKVAKKAFETALRETAKDAAFEINEAEVEQLVDKLTVLIDDIDNEPVNLAEPVVEVGKPGESRKEAVVEKTSEDKIAATKKALKAALKQVAKEKALDIEDEKIEALVNEEIGKVEQPAKSDAIETTEEGQVEKAVDTRIEKTDNSEEQLDTGKEAVVEKTSEDKTAALIEESTDPGKESGKLAVTEIEEDRENEEQIDKEVGQENESIVLPDNIEALADEIEEHVVEEIEKKEDIAETALQENATTELMDDNESVIFDNEWLIAEEKITNDAVDIEEDILESLYNATEEFIELKEKLFAYLYELDEEENVRLAQTFEKVSIAFQQEVTLTHMQSIGMSWREFNKLVTKLSAICGKKVMLKYIGNELKIDRAIAKQLIMPVAYLICQAIYDGIELPNTRQQKGKDEVGRIILKAQIKDDTLIIELKDDGRGIDVERIKEKAIRHRLVNIDETDNLSQQAICCLMMRLAENESKVEKGNVPDAYRQTKEWHLSTATWTLTTVRDKGAVIGLTHKL